MNQTLTENHGTRRETGAYDPVNGGRAGRPGGQEPRVEARVSIRVASSGDLESLRGMFSRSSSETIYRRFHTPFSKVPEWMLALILDVDHHGKAFLVAVAEGEIIGHAMYAELGNGEAEMAIVVEDGWQSKGVGKSLLSGLAERARLRGIETFVGEVLVENGRMLGLAAATFAGTRRTIEDDVYRVRMPLGIPGPTAYTARTHRRAA